MERSKEHMHVEGWQPETVKREELPERATRSVMDEWIGVDEVDAILEKHFMQTAALEPAETVLYAGAEWKVGRNLLPEILHHSRKTGISAGGRLQYHLCLG